MKIRTFFTPEFPTNKTIQQKFIYRYFGPINSGVKKVRIMKNLLNKKKLLNILYKVCYLTLN